MNTSMRTQNQAKKRAMSAMRNDVVNCSSVVAALRDANLPVDTKQMLCNAVRQSLSAFADVRHEFQQGIVEMTEQALVGVESNLQAGVVAAKEKVASVDGDKLQAVLAQHGRARAQLKSNAASSEAALVEARVNFQKTSEALAAAKKDQKAGDADYSRMAASKGSFDSMVNQLNVMKGTQSPARAISKVESDLKSFGVDSSLAATLHSVLVKSTADRSEFDALTLANLDSCLNGKAKEMEAQLSVLEPGRAEREARVAAAQAACDAATAQLQAAKPALKEAQSAVQNGEAAVSAAETELKDIKRTLRLAQNALDEAEQKLANFQSGALATFRGLASRTAAAVQEPALDVQ